MEQHASSLAVRAKAAGYSNRFLSLEGCCNYPASSIEYVSYSVFYIKTYCNCSVQTNVQSYEEITSGALGQGPYCRLRAELQTLYDCYNAGGPSVCEYD